MKRQRTRTVFLLFSVLSISSVLPGRADTWVTVNPDGSVTRTTVTTATGPGANTPAQHYAPGQPLPVAPGQSRTNLSTYGYSVNPYPSGGYYYPGQYSPYYPQPYYPPAPIYNQYYYPPAQAYSGPLHPVPYGTPPWITSIPLGTHYYPPGYAQPCSVCRHYQCHGHRSGVNGSVSIGGGGVSVTINGGRHRTSTRTTTSTGYGTGTTTTTTVRR